MPNRSTYDLANDIVRRAGHKNPEVVPDGTRFDLVLRHILGNPVIAEEEVAGVISEQKLPSDRRETNEGRITPAEPS